MKQNKEDLSLRGVEMTTSADHDKIPNEGDEAGTEKDKQTAPPKAPPRETAVKKGKRPSVKKASARKTRRRRSAAPGTVPKEPAVGTSEIEPEKSTADTPGDEREAISQKQLIEKALDHIRRQLESDKELQPSTIGALEKLLKMYRDIVDQEEVPQEIRVLWQEINGESSYEE